MSGPQETRTVPIDGDAETGTGAKTHEILTSVRMTAIRRTFTKKRKVGFLCGEIDSSYITTPGGCGKDQSYNRLTPEVEAPECSPPSRFCTPVVEVAPLGHTHKHSYLCSCNPWLLPLKERIRKYTSSYSLFFWFNAVSSESLVHFNADIIPLFL